jgi:hypothetical protein
MKKTFEQELKEILDADKTGAVDMDKILADQAKQQAIDLSGEEYAKVKEQLKNQMGDLRARKMMVDAGQKAYAKQIPSGVQKAKELLSKLRGKKGIAAGIAATGTLLGLPQDSMAADIVSKLSDAAEKADPSYYLDKAVKDDENLDKFMKEAQRIQKAKQQEQDSMKRAVSPIVEELGSPTAVKPSDIQKMLGEKEEEDVEDENNDLKIENYNKMLRKKLGYY